MQICQGDYQLCLYRVQSLNKVALTRAVQTSALSLLLQIQGFSNQHPDSCSCASAHSKHPHPIPDGAESTSLGLPRTNTIRSKSLPVTITEQHEPILRQECRPPERSSPGDSSLLARSCLPCAGRAPMYKTVFPFCKPRLYREQNRKFQRLLQPRDHLTSSGTSVTFHQPCIVPAQRCRGAT